MVQTGVYRGYPQKYPKNIKYLELIYNVYIRIIQKLTELKMTYGFHWYAFPTHDEYAYSLVGLHNGIYYPPDHEFVSVFSRSTWTPIDYYHYFFIIRDNILEVSYVNPTEYDIWISGSPTTLANGHAYAAIILYCQETDMRYDIFSDLNESYEPQNISSILQQGTNHIIVFEYSGPSPTTEGSAYADKFYILAVPK